MPLPQAVSLGPPPVKGVIGPSSTGGVTGSVVAASPAKATWYGVGGFARTDLQGGAGERGSAVGLFGVGMVNADNAQAWGLNTITTDSPSNATVQAGVGRAVIGYEADLSVYSPKSIVQGIGLLGSSKVQPAFATGVTVGELSTQAPGVARWTAGFVTADGVLASDGLALVVGAQERRGAHVPSQQVSLNFRDGSGATQAYRIRVDPAGALATASSAGAGAAGLSVDGAVTVAGDLRVAPRTPPTSSAPCVAHTITFDREYVYVCVAADTWRRAALSAW